MTITLRTRLLILIGGLIAMACLIFAAAHHTTAHSSAFLYHGSARGVSAMSTMKPAFLYHG